MHKLFRHAGLLLGARKRSLGLAKIPDVDDLWKSLGATSGLILINFAAAVWRKCQNEGVFECAHSAVDAMPVGVVGLRPSALEGA